MAVHFIIETCEHLQLFGQQIIKTAQLENKAGLFDRHITMLLETLVEQCIRLDPRDFEPHQRFAFLRLRKILEHLIPEKGKSVLVDEPLLCRIKELQTTLEAYRGHGSNANPREFNFIADDELRKIIVRDYRELCLGLLPSDAWKSSVVLAGSILEAILYDALINGAATLVATNSSTKAPSNRPRSPKDPMPTDKWTLEELIDVAEDTGKIPPQHAKSIDQALRDYRNFVHPQKEIRSKHSCREAQALLAKGALDAVIDHLE